MPRSTSGPIAKTLRALARALRSAGVDQRRFPADVRADQQHRVGILDAGDGRVERDRGEARRRRRSGPVWRPSSRRRALPFEQLLRRIHRLGVEQVAGDRRDACARPSSAAWRTASSASFQLASRSLPFSRTHGRSSRLRTSASTWWRVLSLIHSSFTSSLMRGRMRITWRWRTSRRMLEPTASMTSIAGHPAQLPRPALEDLRLLQQRADRADVGEVAGQLARHRLLEVGRDLAVLAAVEHADLVARRRLPRRSGCSACTGCSGSSTVLMTGPIYLSSIARLFSS